MERLCFLCVFIGYTYGTTIYCNNELECTGDIGSSYSSDDYVYGYGYKSVFQSPSSDTSSRYCYGALSCKETPFIDTNYLRCYGTSSCSNIGFIKVTDTIYVEGSNALTNTNISMNGIDFKCYGDKSCAHSTISSFGSSTLYAWGALALFETTINIITGTFTAYFYGYYAGYEATIDCKTGSTCDIYCNYNGCGGLSLLCDSNAQCNIINESVYSLSPNTSLILNTKEILFWNSTEIITTNEDECATQITDKTFDNYIKYQEHSNGANIIYTTNVGPICCRASEACRDSLISYNSGEAYVVCSGYYSCFNLDIISNSNDLMVECSADHACVQGSITSTGNGGSVYCYGYQSCADTTITKISNIYCTAYYSCYYAKITSSGTNISVYLTGYLSGYTAWRTCNKNDHCRILCDAYQACSYMKLYCYGTCVVECNQDTDCPMGWTANPTINPTLNPTNPTINPTVSISNLATNQTVNTNTITIIVVAVFISLLFARIFFVNIKKRNTKAFHVVEKVEMNKMKARIDSYPLQHEGRANEQQIAIENNTFEGLPKYEDIKPSSPLQMEIDDYKNNNDNYKLQIEGEYSINNKNECMICRDGMRCHTFTCGDVFCGECVQQFENGNCPLCQAKLL